MSSTREANSHNLLFFIIRKRNMLIITDTLKAIKDFFVQRHLFRNHNNSGMNLIIIYYS